MRNLNVKNIASDGIYDKEIYSKSEEVSFHLSNYRMTSNENIMRNHILQQLPHHHIHLARRSSKTSSHQIHGLPALSPIPENIKRVDTVSRICPNIIISANYGVNASRT